MLGYLAGLAAGNSVIGLQTAISLDAKAPTQSFDESKFPSLTIICAKCQG